MQTRTSINCFCIKNKAGGPSQRASVYPDRFHSQYRIQRCSCYNDLHLHTFNTIKRKRSQVCTTYVGAIMHVDMKRANTMHHTSGTHLYQLVPSHLRVFLLVRPIATLFSSLRVVFITIMA